jgi:hypothetical protein
MQIPIFRTGDSTKSSNDLYQPEREAVVRRQYFPSSPLILTPHATADITKPLSVTVGG